MKNLGLFLLFLLFFPVPPYFSQQNPSPPVPDEVIFNINVTAENRRCGLQSVRAICAPECLLEIVIGLDEERDRAEIERLNLPKLSHGYLQNILIPKYEAAGFELLEKGVLDSSRWSKMETSWARRLQSGSDQKVVFLNFIAAD